MLERIVDIAERAVRLHIENRLLIIEPPDGSKQTVPVGEVSTLLLGNPAASLSAAVLSELAAAGAIVVICNEKFMPSGMLMPLSSHHENCGRIMAQSDTAAAVKRRAWKQTVQSKIRNQAALLQFLYDNDGGLHELASQVRSDDEGNMEARAARAYWQKLNLMPRRDTGAEDANRLLNYGYTVLLACCARAICCAGLHPAMGMHHRNIYNPFCLASDIMEPYRTLIDFTACRIIGDGGGSVLDKINKSRLISAVINGKAEIGGQKESIFRALCRGVNSYCTAISGDSNEELLLPRILFERY